VGQGQKTPIKYPQTDIPKDFDIVISWLVDSYMGLRAFGAVGVFPCMGLRLVLFSKMSKSPLYGSTEAHEPSPMTKPRFLRKL
jgi:hypothetical protein